MKAKKDVRYKIQMSLPALYWEVAHVLALNPKRNSSPRECTHTYASPHGEDINIEGRVSPSLTERDRMRSVGPTVLSSGHYI